MKRMLMAFLLLPFLSMGQQKGFVINGSLSGIKNKTLVSLTDANNPTDTLAKSVVTDNTFLLKGEITEPGLFTFNVANVEQKGLLFLDNSTMTISGNVAEIQKIKLVGSPSNKDFQEMQEKFSPLFSKLNQLGQQIKTAGMTENLSMQGNKITSEIQAGVDKFVQEKKESYVTPYLVAVTAQLSDNAQLLESRYDILAEDVKKGFYGKYLKQAIDASKIGAIGSDAIDFTQSDPEGKSISLSSFRGKYVLIDFWASWCMPCRMENPNVVNTYNKFKDKNFTVLGVSLDRSRDPWLKAIKDDNLTWTHVSDLKWWSNEVAQKYKIQSIPQNFLIDPNGKIVARDLKGAQLVQRLNELLK